MHILDAFAEAAIRGDDPSLPDKYSPLVPDDQLNPALWRKDDRGRTIAGHTLCRLLPIPRLAAERAVQEAVARNT